MLAWELRKLRDVCEIFNGGTPDTTKPEYWDGNHLWITPKDMGKVDGIFVDDTERKITDAGLKNSSAKLLPKNSVILSSRAPIGHLVINEKEIATNQGCKGLVPKKGLNHLYLFYFLKQSVELLNELGSGTTFKELSGTKLGEILIPLPPLHEQQRIVALLDQAFVAVDQAKANAEINLQNAGILYDTFLQSILSNPDGLWEEKSLGEIFEIARGGSPRPISSFLTNSPDGVNWIKIGDTKGITKYIYETKEKIIQEGVRKSRLVKEGDFLLSNSMSFGKPYIMKTSGCIHDGWLVLSKKSDNINIDFLYHVLGLKLIYQQFDRLAAGSTVRNLNIDLVKKVKIPFPKLEQQSSLVKKIEEFSDEVRKLEKIYQAKIDNLDEFRKSTLSKVFKGEL